MQGSLFHTPHHSSVKVKGGNLERPSAIEACDQRLVEFQEGRRS